MFAWLSQFLRGRRSPLDAERRELRQSLSKLTQANRVVFVACCIERVMPYYDEFCRSSGWDRDAKCQQLLHRLWEHADSLASVEEDDHAIASQFIPLVDCSSQYNAVLVQAAPGMVYLGCRLATSTDMDHAVRAGMAARDVADQLAMEELYPEKLLLHGQEIADAHQAVARHPAMLNEVNCQLADIAALANWPGAESYKALRAKYRSSRERQE